MRAAYAETWTWEVQCPITVLRTSSPSGKTNNLIAPGITLQTFIQHFRIYKGCSHDFNIPGGVAELGLLREIEEYATGWWKYWRSSLLSLIGRHREGVPGADSWWTRQISEGCIGQGQPHEEEYQTIKLQAHPLLICSPSCTGVSFLKHKTVFSCLKRFGGSHCPEYSPKYLGWFGRLQSRHSIAPTFWALSHLTPYRWLVSFKPPNLHSDCSWLECPSFPCPLASWTVLLNFFYPLHQNYLIYMTTPHDNNLRARTLSRSLFISTS